METPKFEIYSVIGASNIWVILVNQSGEAFFSLSLTSSSFLSFTRCVCSSGQSFPKEQIRLATNSDCGLLSLNATK